MSIITATSLNALESKFNPHSLGVEIINESQLTYNKILTAINNGYLPILRKEDTGETRMDVTYQQIIAFGASDGFYGAYTSYADYSATSASAVMIKGGGLS